MLDTQKTALQIMLLANNSQNGSKLNLVGKKIGENYQNPNEEECGKGLYSSKLGSVETIPHTQIHTHIYIYINTHHPCAACERQEHAVSSTGKHLNLYAEQQELGKRSVPHGFHHLGCFFL